MELGVFALNAQPLCINTIAKLVIVNKNSERSVFLSVKILSPGHKLR